MLENVVFVRKTDSLLMRMWAFLVGFFMPSFLQTYWTTLVWPFGKARIYVPSMYDRDLDWGLPAWKDRHAEVLSHELVHVAQVRRYTAPGFMVMYVGPAPFLLVFTLFFGILGPNLAIFGLKVWFLTLILSILSLPLTVGLAYGRYVLEREAFLMQLTNVLNVRSYEATADWIAHVLWADYVLTWPKKWVKAWFLRQKRSK